MRYEEWSLHNDSYDRERKRSRDALFSVGNGYYGIRGFFEEDTEGVDGLGGIYMAGVFGQGVEEAWEGKSREQCNVTNLLRVHLLADGEQVSAAHCENFQQEINLKNGVYTRQYVYRTESGKGVRVKFIRFASLSHKNLAGQRLEIEALNEPVSLEAGMWLESGVTNLNRVSSEPLPVQPGRNHIIRRKVESDYLITWLDDVDETSLGFGQKVCAWYGDKQLESAGRITETACGQCYVVQLEVGKTLVLEKIACGIGKELPLEASLETSLEAFLKTDMNWSELLDSQNQSWERKWKYSDIQIDGSVEDQLAIRYNIFQLISVCPEHTDKLSIGARGLSGEMYEGCVFWDMEIFKFPFYLYTNPEAARKLLMFRYHTLDGARRHGKRNWFEGAMYPWQVSEKGIEQTPYNVGAFYAIHIVSDIAYAISKYWEVTRDDEFIIQYGAEILMETARFFVSRSDYSEEKGVYEIRAVRGPNEYDVYVDNNLYTNMLAMENFKTALKAASFMEKEKKTEWENLKSRIGIKEEELILWKEMAEKIAIPYDEKLGLYLEDDGYLRRRPLDIKKAKPGGKRIIDSTLPYEALPFYQVTKQADVVLLLSLLPHHFTEEEKVTAYEFYESRTAHDSSLSYAPHGLLTATIGRDEESYSYFKKSAFLDIEDRQLNTISGLHYANFGGTWQMVYFGYGGISFDQGVLCIEPRLPKQWKSMKTAISYQGNLLMLTIGNDQVVIEAVEKSEEAVPVRVFGRAGVIDSGEIVRFLKAESGKDEG